MPLYGYQRAVIDHEYGLLELREVSFDMSVADLRRVAAFLSACADQIEAGASRSGHTHIGEHDGAWGRDHPDLEVIVLGHPDSTAR